MRGALRLPALVLLLGVGMAVGSDGLGWIYLDDYSLARRLGLSGSSPSPGRTSDAALEPPPR